MSKIKKNESEDIYAFIERYGQATVAEGASTKEKLAFIEKQFKNALFNYHTGVTLDVYNITVAMQKTLGILK